MDTLPEPSPDFQRETAALRRIARGILLEPGLAEDAVQEAWLAAIQSAKAGAVSGGWLHEAVRRIASGLRRKEARQACRERSAARAERLPSACDTSARLELLRELLAALGELEEPYRTAVELRLVDDLPPRAIAARLGVPVETARTRVKRGVEQLRARLDRRNAHRRADFLAALMPLAALKVTVPAAFATYAWRAIEGACMSLNTKVAAATAVTVVAGLLWFHPWTDVEPAGAGAGRVGAGEVARPADPPGLEHGALASATTDASAGRVAVAEPRPGAADPDATWELRGTARRGSSDVFPRAAVRIQVVAGYEGPGDSVHDEIVHADDRGELHVALRPPATAVRVRSTVTMEGYYSSTEERLVLRGAGAPNDLVATCYALDVVVRGTVLDPRGAALRGASVACLGETVESDADGRFDIHGASAFGTSRLVAWAPGCAEEQRTVTTEAPGKIEGIEIRLSTGVTLRGRVVDDGGEPVAGAEITCFGVRGARVRSAADGRFTLERLRADRSWISVGVRADGFARFRTGYRDGPPADAEVVYALQRGVDLAGSVVDAAGRGIPGAELFIGESRFDVDVLTGIAGDDGRFLLRDVPRSAAGIEVEAAGFAPTHAPLAVPERGPLGDQKIVLDAGAEIAGTIVDPDGSPLPHVRVSVLRKREYLGNVRAATDAQGRFRIGGVPRSPDLTLELYAAKRVRKSLTLDTGAAQDLRIVLERAAGFVGRVIDKDTGDPIRNFRVRFVRPELAPGDVSLSGYSADWADEGRDFRDERGEWSALDDELDAGGVTGLEISAPGYGPTIVTRAVARLDPEKEPIVTALGPAARVTGLVVDARDGRPIAGAVVHWVSKRGATRHASVNDDESKGRSALSDAGGAFALDDLPLEPASLFVEHEGHAPVLDGPFDVSRATPPRTIQMSSGATLRGILHDAAGQAVPGAPVLVATTSDDRPNRSWRLETDVAGRFEVRDLAAGTYQVARELRHDHGAVMDLSREVRIAGDDVVEVDVRPNGSCRLRGELVGGQEPVQLARVSAFSKDPSNAQTTSWRGAIARNGRFEIEGLARGHWQIMVTEIGPNPARHGSGELDVDAAGDASVAVEMRGP